MNFSSLTKLATNLLMTELKADLGKINFDVSYGGNFYAIIDKQENYTDLNDYKAEQLIRYSREFR